MPPPFTPSISRPSTDHQSSPSSIVKPLDLKPFAIASMRSLSFTLNSLTSRINVLPFAKDATTERIGYSSIMLAALSGGTSIPIMLGENLARMSATGSPP